MTSKRVYKEEELNCFKLSDIIQTAVSKGLRKIFEKEWYRCKNCHWKDRQVDRTELYKWMSREPTKYNFKDLDSIRHMRIEEWDCTKLCNVILFLKPKLSTAIFKLKKIRNESSHNPSLKLSTRQLKSKVDTIAGIFQQFGLPDIAREVRFIEGEKRFGRGPSNLEATFKICKLPLPPSHEYTYRKQEVEDISSRLDKIRASIDDDAVCVFYIYGNAGSGKSQVARQVGEKRHKTNVAKVVATLNAENSTTMVDSLGKLASDLGCEEERVNSAMQLSDEQKGLRILSNSVRSRIKHYPWLLIVENITKSSSFKDSWPQPGDQTWGRGHVVVTTQDARTVPHKSKFTDNICLSNGMIQEDAKNLLISVSNVDAENLSAVAQALDNQPLALASAATYVKEASVSWEEYISKLKEGKQESTEELFLNTNSGSYRKTMTSAVMLFSQYMWDDDPVLKKAFTFLAFCAPEQPVPLELIIQYVTRNDAKLDEGVVRGKLKACTHLLLDNIREGAVDKIVTRHQVVQRSFERLVEETLKPSVETSAIYGILSDILITFKVYYESFHKSWDASTVLKKRLCFQHLTKIAEFVARKSDFLVLQRNLILEDCLERLGHFCRTYSKHKTAQTFYKLAIQLKEKAYGHQHYKVAVVQSKLGDSHLHLGNLDEAEKCCSDALEVLRLASNEGEVEVSIAETLTSIGLVHEKKGNLTKSKDFLIQALEMLDVHPPSDLEVKALTFNSLGTVCYRLGDYHGSYNNIEKALCLRRKENNPKISQSLCNLGFVASEIDKLEIAEQYLEEAFIITASKYDTDNNLFAYIFCNKGIVSRRMGKLDEAKQYSLEACENFRRFADDPSDIAEATDYLGMVCYERQEYEEAKKCHEEAIDTWKKTYGEVIHPKLGRFEQNLGLVFEATDDLTSAMQHYKTSLKIMETCGEFHPKVAEALERIASVYRKLGKTSEAMVASNRALQIRKKVTAESDEDGRQMRKRPRAQSQTPPLCEIDKPDSKKQKDASTHRDRRA